MPEYICDHAYLCKQNPESTSKVSCCSAKRPHRFNHEECDGSHCPHANGAWVKCIPMTIPNPVLPHENSWGPYWNSEAPTGVTSNSPHTHHR